MENTENSEVFSNEELEKAIETYNLYIANKEAFEKVYNEDFKYDENKSFLENAKDEINGQSAEAKIEATHPDGVKLATYIFNEAACPILNREEIKITNIIVPEYGQKDFPELDVYIQKEGSDIKAMFSLDCDALRVGEGIIEKETRNNITFKKVFKGEHPFFEDEGFAENFVFSKNKFDGVLSLQKLKDEIIPKIKEDSEILIKEFLKNLEEETEDNKDFED